MPTADDLDLLRFDDAPDDALGHAHAEPSVVGIADGVGDGELVAFFVEQIHGERVKRNQTPDQFGGFLEELVDIEHRRHLTPQIEHRQENVPFAHYS